ncbi:unnamed protein product [Strongylus vulgaris]|uniref:Uncharacterized protein n=1 Tax=Strongylus vulgaris TaxID=40348 RepID=A0A3P7J2B3_STRVU|nr:unnamed protein product [Strongylus vulgaris]
MENVVQKWPVFVDHEEEVYSSNSKPESQETVKFTSFKRPAQTRGEIQGVRLVHPHETEIAPTPGTMRSLDPEPEDPTSSTLEIKADSSAAKKKHPKEGQTSSSIASILGTGPFFDFLIEVAQTGKSVIPWEDVQPAFFEYLQDALYVYEENFREINHEENDMSEGSENWRIYHFIQEKMRNFDNFPFTFRRLCELLVDPTRWYTKFPTFMRALERVVNVEATIPTCTSGESAARFPPEEENIESIFFRSPNDSFDKLDINEYAPDPSEVQNNSNHSADSSCDVCEASRYKIRRKPPPLRRSRQAAGADAKLPLFPVKVKCIPDEKEDLVAKYPEQIVNPPILNSPRTCPKRQRTDESLMIDFAKCTITKRPLIKEEKSVLEGANSSRVAIARPPRPGLSASFLPQRNNYEFYEYVSEEEVRREMARGSSAHEECGGFDNTTMGVVKFEQGISSSSEFFWMENFLP